MKAMLFLGLFLGFHAQAQLIGKNFQFVENRSGLIHRAFVETGAQLGETYAPEHFVFATSDGNRYTPTADVTELTQVAMKIVGKGVRTEAGEALALACVGAQAGKLSCDYLRALYHNPITQKTYAFGMLFKAGNEDLKSFFKSLKNRVQAHQEGYRLVTENRFISLYSDQFTNRDGWNWSSSPKQIDYNRFLSIVAELNYFPLEWIGSFRKVKGMIFAEMIQPQLPLVSSPWYSYRGEGYGITGKFHSVDE